MPVSLDCVAHVLERFAGDALHVRDLGRGLRDLTRRKESARELALDRDHRQAVAEQIMQVAGEPQSLLIRGA